MCGFRDLVYRPNLERFQCKLCDRVMGKDFYAHVRHTLPESYYKDLDRRRRKALKGWEPGPRRF